MGMQRTVGQVDANVIDDLRQVVPTGLDSPISASWRHENGASTCTAIRCIGFAETGELADFGELESSSSHRSDALALLARRSAEQRRAVGVAFN
jgi:hypothetical protein